MRYFKLTLNILMARKTTTYITNIFFDYWLTLHGIPTYMSTRNGIQLVSRFCCNEQDSQRQTPDYNNESSIDERQSRENNMTILLLLQHNVAKYQKDWDNFVQPLTYAGRTKVYFSINQTPFSLVLSRRQPRLTLLQTSDAVATDAHAESSPQVLPAQLETCIGKLREKVDSRANI